MTIISNMGNTNLSYRCYILPAIGAIGYYLLSLPIVNKIFNDWIPDYYYATLVKSLILLIILFLTCRIMDIFWTDMCHDNSCITIAACECNNKDDNDNNGKDNDSNDNNTNDDDINNNN